MLRKALINSLAQINEILDVIEHLPKEKSVAFYCDSNAGKHVRHVLDHLLAFILSAESGVVDYNQRNREVLLNKTGALHASSY